MTCGRWLVTGMQKKGKSSYCELGIFSCFLIVLVSANISCMLFSSCSAPKELKEELQMVFQILSL